MGPRTHLSFCACKAACLASQLLVSMGPSLHLWFLDAKQRLWTRTTSLYGSQVSPVVLCLQNSVISTRITSLYGAQPSSVVFACKTAIFGAELQISMAPRPHLCLFQGKQWLLEQNNKSLQVPTCRFVHVQQRT